MAIGARATFFRRPTRPTAIRSGQKCQIRPKAASARHFTRSSVVKSSPRRLFSAAADASDTTIILSQVEANWADGKVLETERRLKMALDIFPTTPSVLARALELSELIGSREDQDRVLALIRGAFEKLAASESAADDQLDRRSLTRLISDLYDAAYIFDGMGIHSMALKRLEIAALGTRWLPESQTQLIADINTKLAVQRQYANNGREDSIVRTPVTRGFSSTAWEARHDLRTAERDVEKLLRSMTDSQTVGKCLDADLDFESALFLMRDNLDTLQERLQLPTREAAKEYIADLVSQQAGRLMMRDELGRTEILLDQSAWFLPADSPAIAKVRKILRELKVSKNAIPSEARISQRPKHRILWQRMQTLLKQAEGEFVDASVETELRQLILQIAESIDPEAALEKNLWAGFASIKRHLFQHTEKAVAELRNLAQKASEDPTGPPPVARKRVLAQLELEAEYIQAKDRMVKVIMKDSVQQEVPAVERWEALCAANRAIALTGSPTMDAKTLTWRAQIYSGAGMSAEAMRDAALAAATYPGDSEVRFSVCTQVSQVQGSDSEISKELFSDCAVALVGEWQRNVLSQGVFNSRSMPSKEALDKLLEDTNILDLVSSAELSPTTPSRAQISNATACLLYRYAPANAKAIEDSLDDALRNLDPHFDSSGLTDQKARDVAKAGLLFNKAAALGRHLATVSKGVPALTEAETIYRSHNRPIPPHWHKLRGELSSNLPSRSLYPWSPL